MRPSRCCAAHRDIGCGWTPRARCARAGSRGSFRDHRAARQALLVRIGGKTFATPLLVALVAVESADAVFAVDSIPAVFAVTRDPYLVYTSNIFALLGLRSLFAIVGDLVERFPYVRYALAALLLFVAVKLGAFFVRTLVGSGIARRDCRDPRARSGRHPVAARAAAIDARDRSVRHRAQERNVEPADDGCTECRKIGDVWTHLRMCLICGNVGCCDSSKNKHAARHFAETGHPLIRSLEAGEDWKWCYIDEAVVEFESGDAKP